jgi:hypothetical protein
MARPKKVEFSKDVHIRLTQSDREYIEQQAVASGLTFSEYIRRCALNKKVRSRVNIQVIGELSRLGGMQKHLLMQIKGLPHEQTLRAALNSTLAQLHDTLRSLIKVATE